jgi:hypothetical protein
MCVNRKAIREKDRSGFFERVTPVFSRSTQSSLSETSLGMV